MRFGKTQINLVFRSSCTTLRLRREVRMRLNNENKIAFILHCLRLFATLNKLGCASEKLK